MVSGRAERGSVGWLHIASREEEFKNCSFKREIKN
jgi:hypothetical protein